jgi:hypothetical protein
MAEPEDHVKPETGDRGPTLETLLRDAADDAGRRVAVPAYESVVTRARRRRTGRVAVAGAFGLVACVVLGVTVAAGGVRGPAPGPQPLAPANSPLIPTATPPALATPTPVPHTADPGDPHHSLPPLPPR